MKIPKNTSKREIPDEGTHNAVCIQAIDFGTQPGSQKFPDEKRKIQLAYQLVEEKTTDGKAMVIYKMYTFSASTKSSLSRDLKAWLNIKDLNNFDMDEVLGKSAMITVQQTETENGTYANITNISALPKGMKPKKATEPLVSFYLDEDNFDAEVFKQLPEWMQLKIAGSPEYKLCTAGNAAPPKEKPAKEKANGKATASKKKK